MIKKIICLFLIFSIIFVNLCCYAFSIPITKENLESSFKAFEKSTANSSNIKLNSIGSDTITFKAGSNSYNVKYSLKNDPTFTYELTINKGMSYEDYQNKTAGVACPTMAFFAIAYSQGASIDKVVSYFTNSTFNSVFSQLNSGTIKSSGSIMIVADGVTVTSSSAKVIKASEFGNYAIDYAKTIYGDGATIRDTLFEYSTELKDITSTSCKLVSKMVVKQNGDYSSMVSSRRAAELASQGTPVETKGDKTVEFTIGTKSNLDDVEDIPKLTDILGTKYENAVNTLLSLGVVNGFDDNTFKSDENVTRAQFAKMLVESTKLEPTDGSGTLNFSDVPESHWAYNYIKIAVQNNVINGYPEGLFKPDNTVTYVEAMAMILRAMKLEASMLDKSWPSAYINEAKKVGLLDSVDYSFPEIEVNRGETAISLYNMINLLNSGKKLDSINAEYAKGEAIVTLREDDGKLEFTLTGMVDGLYAYVRRILDYSNGYGVTEGDYLGYAEKLSIQIDGDKLIVQSHSADPESLLNQISGTYYLN